MVKKRRGAAEVVVSRDEAAPALESESRDVVGSRWF
jgi:hypothetical protein